MEIIKLFLDFYRFLRFCKNDGYAKKITFSNGSKVTLLLLLITAEEMTGFQELNDHTLSLVILIDEYGSSHIDSQLFTCTRPLPTYHCQIQGFFSIQQKVNNTRLPPFCFQQADEKSKTTLDEYRSSH